MTMTGSTCSKGCLVTLDFTCNRLLTCIQGLSPAVLMQEDPLREFMVREQVWNMDSNHRRFFCFHPIEVPNIF